MDGNGRRVTRNTAASTHAPCDVVQHRLEVQSGGAGASRRPRQRQVGRQLHGVCVRHSCAHPTHARTHPHTKSTQNQHNTTTERGAVRGRTPQRRAVCVCVCVCVCVLEEGGIPAPRHKTVTRQLARRRRGLFAHTWECPPQTRRPPRRTHVHRQQTTDPAAPSETNARTEGETAARPKTGGRSAHCAMCARPPAGTPASPGVSPAVQPPDTHLQPPQPRTAPPTQPQQRA